LEFNIATLSAFPVEAIWLKFQVSTVTLGRSFLFKYRRNWPLMAYPMQQDTVAAMCLNSRPTCTVIDFCCW